MTQQYPFKALYPEEPKIEKDTCTPVFVEALFMIGKTWKQPRCSLTDEWIKKLWYIYTMDYLFYIQQCICFHATLSIHFTLSCLCPCLFSISVSPLQPCKQVHQYHLCRFHIYVLTQDICFSLSDLLHSVQQAANTFESVLMRWMNLQPIIQSEVSQKEKSKNCLLTLTYGIQKDDTDEPICRAAVETQTQETDLRTQAGEGR